MRLSGLYRRNFYKRIHFFKYKKSFVDAGKFVVRVLALQAWETVQLTITHITRYSFISGHSDASNYISNSIPQVV